MEKQANPSDVFAQPDKIDPPFFQPLTSLPLQSAMC